jgi:fermentation-respiration switch protein FrsA (DUF1100 family)
MAKLRKQYALLPIQLLSQRFDSIQKVSKLRLPVLYIHGTADEVVPYAMGEQLFGASGGTITTPPSAGRCFALRSETSSRSSARLRLRVKEA